MSSFRRDAPLVLIAAITVVILGVSYVTHVLFSGLVDEVEAGKFDLMRSILGTAISDAESRALARAQMIADLPTVQRALATGDREALVAETLTLYRHQNERFGVAQAQFHLPPATSFLRLNAPDKGHGEDLSSFRPLVVEANAQKVALKGPAMGRSGPAIMGIAPITDAAGTHVGTFEIGLDYGALLEGLKRDYDLDGALFVEEEALKATATLVSGDVVSDQNRVGRFIRFTTTHVERMAALVSDRDLSGGQERRYVAQAGGVPYGVVVLPVKTFSGKPIGMLAVTQDFSGSRAAAGRMIVWQSLVALVAVVLLAGVVLVVVRGLVLTPLRAIDQRLAALADGNDAAPLDPDDLCDEMAGIARSTEKLRAKVKPGEAA